MRSKWWFRSSTGALLAIMLLASSLPGAYATSGGVGYVPGELIAGMALRNGRPEGDMEKAAARVGAVIKDVSTDGAAYLLSFKSEAAASRALPALQASTGVRFVERNGIASIPPLETLKTKSGEGSMPAVQLFKPDDSLRGYQWHLDKILYQLADQPGYAAPCIVVLDTGVDYTHPDLSGKVYKGRDFFDGDNDPMDNNGHGTHVAGIAAGKTDNILGISGVSPQSNILAVRVLGYDGSGTWWAVAKGIQWANARDKTACGGQEPLVYNMSIGGDHSALVSDVIAAAQAKGRLVVAAAGNSNSSLRSFPGDDPNAFGVAATEENDRRAFFSNYDTPSDPWVDIAAPGFQILSTYFLGSYQYLSGTSMATPVVAGVAARIWGLYPQYTADQVRARIQDTADPAQGFPRPIKRVNLYRALGGARLTFQGMVLDSVTAGPLAGAAVTVSANGVQVCAATTSASGFYTCGNLLSAGTYQVRAAKAGRIATTRSFQVTGSRFNANLALTRPLGTSTSGDWTATILWGGWQPFDSKGLEADIWLVDPGVTPVCYSPWSKRQDQDTWNLLLPVDSFLRSQTESAWIKRSYGGKLQVWVTLWDGSLGRWPSSARITGSQLQIRIYKNNQLVTALNIPDAPTTSTADNWFVGTIDLNAGSWTLVNRIKTDAQLPFCIQVP